MNKKWRFIFIVSIVLLGKGTGFFKDVLMTYYHGVSAITDAYFLANSISSLLYMAVYAAIPIIVVPFYTRILADSNGKLVSQKITQCSFFIFLLSTILCVFVFLGARPLVELFSGEAVDQVKDLSVGYLSIMSLTFTLSSLVSILNSIQTVNSITIPSYVVPTVNNLVFCCALFVFHLPSEFYMVLLFGVFAWIFLVFVNYSSVRSFYKFKFSGIFEKLYDRSFILLFLPAIVAFYVEQANSFIGIHFASKIGLGSISFLGYSNKLNMIFLSVFTVFLTASIFPRIAAFSVRNDKSELTSYLISCIRYVFIFSFPIIVFMVFYSDEIVSLLFQRGKFLVDDVVIVAFVFSVMFLGLPLCLVRDIMNRVFFSYGNTFIPVLISSVSAIVNFLISFFVYRQYGLIGLAFSVLLSSALNCILITLIVQKNLRVNLLMPSFIALLRCLASLVFAFFSLFWLDNFFGKYWIGLFLPFFVIYISFLIFLRMDEAIYFLNICRKWFFRNFNSLSSL